VLAVKVKLVTYSDEVHDSIIPVVVPDLDEVRTFALRLHTQNQLWQGYAFGWSAEYNPERVDPPLDSHMTFTPADFCIGESGIWFFSMLWEYGHDVAPAEYLDDQNILEPLSA